MPYTPEQRRIFDEAMSPTPAANISPESLHYRATGTFGTPEQTTRQIDFSKINPPGYVAPQTGGGTQSIPGMGGSQTQSTRTTQNSMQGSGGNSADNFNLLMMDLLKRGQGVDTAELLKRRRALQRTVVGRQSEITPEELRTLSPGQQESVRQGNVKALRPDIDENAYQIEKAQQAADNFEKVYQQALQFGEKFAEKMVAPDNIIQSYKTLIENGESMSTVLSGVNEKTRAKVIENLYYNKMSKAGTIASDRKQVVEMLMDYPDAGILASDSLEQAAEKIKSSKIYAQRTRLAGGGGGGGSTKKLSSAEIKNIKELYGITLPYGTTESEASAMITKLGEPREFNQIEISTIAQAMYDQKLSYDDAINEINIDDSILNKKAVIDAVNNIYGIKEKLTPEQQAKINTQMKISGSDVKSPSYDPFRSSFNKLQDSTNNTAFNFPSTFKF